MANSDLKITAQSIRTELKSFEDKPYECLFEYIWNSLDAGASEIRLNFSTPPEGLGYVKDVALSDNGKGWDFDDEATTNNFMSSTKTPEKNKTLPKGQYGRGRYAFIWIADKIEVYSKSKKLTLQHNTNVQTDTIADEITGTRIEFIGINGSFSDALASDRLQNELAIEFGWFLLENNKYRIYINDKLLNISSIIKDSLEYKKVDLPKELQRKIVDDFFARIIIWEKKPSEYSKYYFIDRLGKELTKINTGLNKKSDEFWHSVYIQSSLFTNDEQDLIDDENNSQAKIEFDGTNSITKKQIIDFFKKELINIRKPYLKKQSDSMYESLVVDNAIPDLAEFDIYDEQSFSELLKTVYIISPTLFTNRSNAEKKFICATFAGLLSTRDDNLIKVVLEQLQELTDDEKRDLLDILSRTRLSNVVSTIKEIDHRLEVIEKIKILISEWEKETLEVKHLQKILDNNFWIFGEQFRLFSSTEGALKNVIVKYATEILNIENPELANNPRGEVDLFLTKTESTGESIQKNIVVELKRASKTLGKEQYDQIEGYMRKIKQENLCNGENQLWEFYLIGKDYNDEISEKIEAARNFGEKARGLCYNINDGRFKIYVRKWSDILEVEWGYKMKYLKEKLKIKQKDGANTPDEITKEIIS
ncbi:MAG: ATP-binding protein [Salinivirgaceae bacterium]|nr:ATP-binding protein [Salinivirgaceae bacterium]